MSFRNQRAFSDWFGHKHKRYIFIVIVLLALLTLGLLWWNDPRKLCERSGGRWVHDGMFGQAQYCQYTYADGGTPCRSSKECQGGCVIYDLPVNGKPLSTAGVCRFTNSIFGCWAPIENPGRYRCFD